MLYTPKAGAYRGKLGTGCLPTRLPACLRGLCGDAWFVPSSIGRIAVSTSPLSPGHTVTQPVPQILQPGNQPRNQELDSSAVREGSVARSLAYRHFALMDRRGRRDSTPPPSRTVPARFITSRPAGSTGAVTGQPDWPGAPSHPAALRDLCVKLVHSVVHSRPAVNRPSVSNSQPAEIIPACAGNGNTACGLCRQVPFGGVLHSRLSIRRSQRPQRSLSPSRTRPLHP